jgi:hypothetical protein
MTEKEIKILSNSLRNRIQKVREGQDMHKPEALSAIAEAIQALIEIESYAITSNGRIP